MRAHPITLGHSVAVSLLTVLALAACSDDTDDTRRDTLADTLAGPDGDATTTANEVSPTDSSDATATAPDGDSDVPVATEVGPDSSADSDAQDVAEVDLPTDTILADTEPTTEVGDADVQDGEVQGDPKIHVTIYDTDGKPLPGVDVVFHDAAGQPTSVAVSDGQGRVEVDAAGVAMVTAIFADPTAPKLTTIMGLTPGQEVAIGTPPAPATGVAARSVTLQAHLPAAAPDADTYAIATGCGSHQGSYVDTLETPESEICWTGDHRIDVFAAAMTSAGGASTPLAFALAPDVAVTESDTVSVSLEAWRTDWQRFTATLEGIPDAIDELSYALTGRLGGQVFPIPWARGTFAAGGGDHHATDVPIPPAFFTGLGASITISAHGAAVVSEQSLTWEGAGVPDTLTANVDQIRLPLFSAVTGAWTENSLRVDWTADRSLAGTTAITADVFWSSGDIWVDWTIQAPGRSDAFLVAPRLPDAFKSLLPAASVGAPLANLQVVDLGAPTTFATFQATCGTSFGCHRLRAPAGTWERWGSAGSPDL